MKKGFTLIELLAVIIVFGVIALIATPIVLDVIDSAKLKAFEESAYGIIETVKLKNYDSMLENNDKTYIFPTDELVFQGERPKGGTVISVNGEIILAIHNGKYCATKKLGDEKVTITENISNCDLKYVNLNGTINQTNPILAKVELIKNDKVIYETTSDESGNYVFDNIISDKYLILVSQPSKTKYGREINLTDDNTTNDMSVTLYSGDVDGNNIIDNADLDILTKCLKDQSPECINSDINNDGVVNSQDMSILKSHFNKFSNILLDDNVTIHGKIKSIGTSKPEVKLYNSNIDIVLDDNNSFEITVPKGYYRLVIKKGESSLDYQRFAMYKDNINIDVEIYMGDFDNNGVIDNADVVDFENVMDSINNGDYTYDDLYWYDLNEDGKINSTDMSILLKNIGKKYKY